MSFNYRYGRSSNMSEFRSDYPITNEQIAKYAPSVLAESAHESRGQRYTFIPTLAVLDGLRQEGFQPYEVRQTRCRDLNRREFTKHMVRMRHPDASVITMEKEVPEIVLLNSHDGTSSYQIIAGFFRKICSNGLIAGDVKHDVRVRHSGNVIQDVIEGSFRVVDDIKEISHEIDHYKAITLNASEQFLLADAAHQIRWEENAPVEATDLLRARRYEDRKDDLWTTFNRIQENVLKGGLEGRTATGRRTSTRAVSGVNENVKLNRALWTLADRFAALKEGRPIPEVEIA